MLIWLFSSVTTKITHGFVVPLARRRPPPPRVLCSLARGGNCARATQRQFGARSVATNSFSSSSSSSSSSLGSNKSNMDETLKNKNENLTHCGNEGSKDGSGNDCDDAGTTPIAATDFLSPLARSIFQQVHDLVGNQTNAEAQHQNIQLVLSVSGGCDSVALLHACMEVKRQWLNNHFENNNSVAPSNVDGYGFDIHVVHFHHRQRPQEADKDCRFVQDLVEEYNNTHDQGKLIESFHVEDWNEYMDGTNNSDAFASTFSQDKARQWRRTKLVEYTQYQLQQSAGNNTTNNGIGIILTAHHQDDSHESALLKLLRGAHFLNWQGMEAVTRLSLGTSRSNDGDARINLLRPFLQYSKQHLMDYLLDRNLTWREDASNTDNKYLRNRIRNELVPLLQDMTDNAFLEKRLPTMMQQSQMLWEDVEPRVQACLEQELEQQSNGDALWKIDAGRKMSKLIYSQALYRWMTCQVDALSSMERNEMPFQLSYNALERVMKQLERHSESAQWTLELGNHINIIRQGGILKIQKDDGKQVQKQDINEQNLIPWHWTKIRHEIPEQGFASSHDTMFISFPEAMLPESRNGLAFFTATLGDLTKRMENEGGEALRFIPPWRTSPIKMRQFLRGQNIPIHQRDNVDLLMGATQNEDGMKLFVVAVYLESEWIVHRLYCIRPPQSDSSLAEGREGGDKSLPTTVLQLSLAKKE